MTHQVLVLDPGSYARHVIHDADRCWAESNCYVDVLVELLHAWGYEPIAALPFTLAIDFEGDQWTFFKFPLADLADLFGLDVQELAVWRPLVTHVEEQIKLGRPVLVELDSYYLPDTAGSAYRIEHVKTAVAVIEIDVTDRRLGYFHGQGYHRLQGDDFTKVFRLDGLRDPAILSPYVEIVKRRASPPLRGGELTGTSVRLLRRQLGFMPESNPFQKFKRRFEEDWKWLAHESLDTFHKYSFATLRQFGACYELAATYLRWLQRETAVNLAGPATAFQELSTSAKTLQFTLARSMTRKKGLDLSSLDTMAELWENACADLRAQFL